MLVISKKMIVTANHETINGQEKSEMKRLKSGFLGGGVAEGCCILKTLPDLSRYAIASLFRYRYSPSDRNGPMAQGSPFKKLSITGIGKCWIVIIFPLMVKEIVAVGFHEIIGASAPVCFIVKIRLNVVGNF